MDVKIKRLRYASVLFALACLWCASVAQAQTTPLLQLNTYAEGEISAGRAQRWQFVARQGAMLTFYVRAVEDTLDPVISIATIEGVPLISNDDAAYGVTSDALIEGFTAPRNGTYVITVNSFGEKNTGFYQIVMLSGYGEILTREEFSNNPLWMSLLENTGSPLMNVDTTAGNMLLAMTGESQSGIVTVGDQDALYQNGYATTQISIVSLRGWEAGLTLRHIDEDNYYLYRVNSNAQWRFEAVIDGETTVLKDWERHPAVSGRNEFSLGALLNGTTLELFFDGQAIGAFTGLTLTDAGRIGFFAGTPAIANASVEARFDNFVVTTPLTFDNEPVFPAQVIVATANEMVRELQRRRFVPLSGVLISDNQSMRVQDSAAGISRLPFTEGKFTNFIFGTNVAWVQDKTGIGGCGITLREESTDDAHRYEFAFVGSDGRYGMQHREPDEFTAGGLYGENLKPGNAYHLMVVALDDELHFYIDGVYYGTLEQPEASGSISAAVVNFDQIRTVCNFQNAWLWSFDS